MSRRDDATTATERQLQELLLRLLDGLAQPEPEAGRELHRYSVLGVVLQGRGAVPLRIVLEGRSPQDLALALGKALPGLLVALIRPEARPWGPWWPWVRVLALRSPTLALPLGPLVPGELLEVLDEAGVVEIMDALPPGSAEKLAPLWRDPGVLDAITHDLAAAGRNHV